MQQHFQHQLIGIFQSVLPIGLALSLSAQLLCLSTVYFNLYAISSLVCAAIDFINKAADVAEAESHHPDLHITNYRYEPKGLSWTLLLFCFAKGAN
eukprot:1138608-Pelagomonas_calceolata.AAC.4